ncbi:MAG: PD-(D/E)XK nuclease family protein [Deltaproteobacteria bacterium]|nr:PD-(D/E)XK nuclease family protein [Deltaproteobacteria bacterium]
MTIAPITPLLSLLKVKPGAPANAQPGTIFPPTDLVIVPNEMVAFQVRDQIMSRLNVLLRAQIFSFSHLERRLAEERWPELVDDWDKIFFLNRQAPSLRPILGLSGEPTIAQTAELADQLADGLDRLRLAGLTWPEVGALAPQALAQALASLGEAYDRWLGEREDQFTLRLKIIHALKKGEDFRFLREIQTIHCYHSQRLSPFETELLKALALSGRMVKIRLDIPPWLTEERRDHGGLNWGFQRLRLMEEFYKSPSSNLELKFADQDDPDYEDTPAPLAYASQNIFGPPVDFDPPPVGEALVILKAPTRYQEVEAVGRDLKKMILAGVPPRHLATAVPHMDTYLADFLDIGRRFGIEFYCHRGEPLINAAPVLAINDLLALFTSNWELLRFLEVARSPYFNFGVKDWPLESILSAGISDDRAGGAYELNLERAIAYGQKTELVPVLTAVKLTRALGVKLSQQKTWPHFFATFAEILEILGWPNLSDKPANLLKRQRWPQWSDKVLNIWPDRPSQFMDQTLNEYGPRLKLEEVAAVKYRQVLEELALAVAGSVDAPEASLEAFRFWSRRALGAVSLGSSGSSPSSGVWLVNYYDLNGARFEKLYLLGLNESVFPSAKAEGRWWPDEFIKSLAQTSLGRSLWTGPQEGYRQGEEMFATALGQAKSVVLSYAENTEGARKKALSPSAVIKPLLALWSKDPPKTVAVGRSLKLNDLRDKGELLTYLAEKNVDPPENILRLIPAENPALLWASLKARRVIQAPLKNLSPAIIDKWINTFSRLSDGPILSLSPLRDYAQCSRKFWLAHILKLTTAVEPMDDWDRISQGDLVHGVLREFMRPLVDVTEKKDLSWSRLKEIFEVFSSNLARNNPVGREPIFERQLTALGKSLRSWLARQADLAKTAVKALEWPFGNDPKETSLPAPGPAVAFGQGQDKVYLRGRVDRVDITKDPDSLIIRDYKLTHSDYYDKLKRNKNEVNDAKSFDKNVNSVSYAPLLYRLAVENHFGLPTRAFFEFINPKDKSVELEVDFDLQIFQDFMANLWRDLRRGVYREPKDCDDCHFRFVCSQAAPLDERSED